MEADVPRLMVQLEASEIGERRLAAETLCRLGEQARQAAVPLVRAVADDDEEVAQWAVAALEELGSPAAAQIGQLLPLLADSDSDRPYWAATLLGRAGPLAAAAVPKLCEALAPGNAESTRERAAWALGKIGAAASQAQEPLRKAVEEGSPRLARLASAALKEVEGH